MDGLIHDGGRRTQYADFSGWDIYRTQIPLLAMLEPRRASDIVASMLADADQSGCLPRWSYANGQSMTMVGDPGRPDHRLGGRLRRPGLRRGGRTGGDGQGRERGLPQPRR